MAVKAKTTKQAPLPTIGRQGAVGSAKKIVATAAKTKSGKGNGSILSFFKKTDGEGLFVEEKIGLRGRAQEGVPEHSGGGVEGREEDDCGRWNERGGSVKRRKTGGGDVEGEGEGLFEESDPVQETVDVQKPQQQTRTGPFMEESDSEDDDDPIPPTLALPTNYLPPTSAPAPAEQDKLTREVLPQTTTSESELIAPHSPPALIKQETSYAPDDFQDFGDDLEDFDEDLFEQGDEFVERRYMQEQAALEGEDDDGEKDYDPVLADGPLAAEGEVGEQAEGPTCPICSISLAGVGEVDAGTHVNNCLDGNPTPLPGCSVVKEEAPVAIKSEGSTAAKQAWPINGLNSTAGANQYKRPVRAAKPGQTDPFESSKSGSSNGTASAFGKLMSGHAEDAAWAEAAAAEHKSRGKPAYERTCPFYKVMPGMFICVDAFRYGAVAGCKAYFLSHFHSDHYIGLTSSWCHGPIYCSRVTGNLVRQQLRVDPKWVVDLEFDSTVEVPGTKGVNVTMIDANHCPGSSLYLFEKVTGKKTNGEDRVQRILHCGDFRACRAHVEHPLLMPDVRDKLSGKMKEQHIDVCYLDTTYLNPKYAFPSQRDVIQACADMCVSLSKHSVDGEDGWEQMKRRRAGEGMVKFIQREGSRGEEEIKQEEVDGEEGGEKMKLLRNPAASQQVFNTAITPDVKSGRGRLLVVVGTYSIGKERICIGIAKALGSKIYAPPAKQKIVAALEDAELNALMTKDPREAQVHMTPLFEIRADTLDDYLKDYFPHFTRCVGFRPSGWNYKPPASRFLESPSVGSVLEGANWKSGFGMKDLVPQRGSTGRSSCFGVPYSEHSSFRELTMFCCGLRVGRVVPTVNVGSAKGRERMKGWVERWRVERGKMRGGVWQLPEDGSW
ncbi:DNA cross-link repair protein PSO2/SNM1 [Elasticomyces elasticus]|nr:DNA cross-link repair protein PSO2/SNM1 [Elasticomyces elasticus]KAK3667107.1 DNA cross-link repair protein PSO2/SNM1 [Elasticomyces elasticus]KAK4932882.1 DNA cross-link repair protein PSO2/SNM1 [Elasticomyces elasticus]KAK5768714.1 DNA cross-link repair protein PSO2/SNM1 [Elasticomyces elasticus]